MRNKIARTTPAIHVDPRSGLQIIADYPAYKVVHMPDWFTCKHGTKFCMPYKSRNHGILWHFFTLGSVIGYAVDKGDDPLAALVQAKDRGHKLHWANANAVCIDNMKREKETAFALDFGDIILFEGIRFRLDRAPNDNVALTPVEGFPG
jgi:hypothetical protein